MAMTMMTIMTMVTNALSQYNDQGGTSDLSISSQLSFPLNHLGCEPREKAEEWPVIGRRVILHQPASSIKKLTIDHVATH
jgi:hypothetical protein